MNLTHDRTSLIESAISLRNFTWENVQNITNVVDFHFIVTTIENYIPYLEREPEVCTVGRLFVLKLNIFEVLIDDLCSWEDI